MTGPWPGTSVRAPRARIRSQARSQLANGPAQTMGVPPMNRMSPVKTTPASGTWTIASPSVCAGPTSIRWTARLPTVRSSRPSNVVLGGRSSMPFEPERPEDAADVRGELGAEVVGVLEHAHELRRRGLELRGRAGRRVDLGAGRQEPVPEAVVAVAVRVHRRVDRAALGDAPHRVEHVARELEVEQRVDEQRCPVRRDQARVAPAPGAVGLQVGVQPVPELVEPSLVRDAHGRCLPGSFASLSGRLVAGWRGGRVVECGGLENRFRG